MPFIAGLADQAIQSAVSLGIAVTAGRTLGPEGLGTIALAVAVLLIPLGFHRALVVDPLVTRTRSESGMGESLAAARSATLVFGSGCTAMLLVGGALAPGPVGQSMMIAALWPMPYCLQSLARSHAFRMGRPSNAIAVSATWLAVSTALVAAGLRNTSAELMTSWGLGAAASSLLGVVAAGAPWLLPRQATWAWFRAEALPFGRWLTVSNAIFTGSSYGIAAAISGLMGPAAVGGFRAVESAFSPLSLVAPGLANPAVREIRHAQTSGRSPIRIASAVSGVAALVTLVYGLTLWAGGAWLIGTIFGAGFDGYVGLIGPVCVAQFFLSLAVGYGVVLRVYQRGPNIVVVAAVGSLTPLAATIIVGPNVDLTTLAWTLAACAPLTPLMSYLFAIKAVENASSIPRGQLPDVPAPLGSSVATTYGQRGR